MPALVYRRRRFPAKRRKPKRFVWTAVGPITYEKSGSLAASPTLTGADVFDPFKD